MDSKFLSPAIIAFGLFGPAEAGEEHVCTDGAISVRTQSKADSAELCQSATRAKSLLERCGIPQARPVEITIVENADDARMTGFLGHYSPREDKISLLPASELKAAMADGSALGSLPEASLFASIVVHEMTHAFIVPTECGVRLCRPAHEYIAYALQIESLPESSRDLLLAAVPATEDRDLSYFSTFLLEIAPERFAVEAWRHFSRPENGCELIASILNEGTPFPSDDE